MVGGPGLAGRHRKGTLGGFLSLVLSEPSLSKVIKAPRCQSIHLNMDSEGRG